MGIITESRMFLKRLISCQSFSVIRPWYTVLRNCIKKVSGNQMNTSSPIHHRFDVEIPRGKFMEITSIFWGNQEFFGAGQVSWNRGTSINTTCTTYKIRVPAGKNFLDFSQRYS